MTPLRSFFSWIVGRLWSVALAFAILWIGALAVAEFRELRQLGQTVMKLQAVEAEVKDAAAKARAEAESRVRELDQAAQAAVESRVQTLDEEIKHLSDQIPSAGQVAITIARGDSNAIADWARREVAVRVRQQERDALARILAYRSKVAEYERWSREGPAELERVRTEHVAVLGEIERLDKEIAQLKRDHWWLVMIPGSGANAKSARLDVERKARVDHTFVLKERYEERVRFQQMLQRPRHPSMVLQDLRIDPVLEKLRSAWVERESELKQDWMWRVINYDFNTPDLMKTAVIIVAVASAVPLGVKLAFFYVLAPIATRRPSGALLPGSSGQVLAGRDVPGQESAETSAVSCRVLVNSSNELLVHPEYLQSVPNACESRTQWILNRHIPLSSVAAGLCALTRIRAETPQTVVVSSTRDPLSEVSLIMIPKGTPVVLLPRHIVGVIQARGAPPRITRHWRLFSLHAWLTLQLRYLVFHGPVTLVVKGCRGVRVEAAEAGRSLNPAATMGFSANLRYASRRCETLFGYLSGQQPLLNDSFTGNSGHYIYQAMPYQRRGGFFGRGLEGALDAVLKPLGI